MFRKISLILLTCVSAILLSIGTTSAAFAASDDVYWSRDCGGTLRGYSGDHDGGTESTTNYRTQGNCSGNAWVRQRTFSNITGQGFYSSWTNRASVVTQWTSEPSWNIGFGEGYHKGCGTCTEYSTNP